MNVILRCENIENEKEKNKRFSQSREISYYYFNFLLPMHGGNFRHFVRLKAFKICSPELYWIVRF